MTETNLPDNQSDLLNEHRRVLKENVALLKDNEHTLRKTFELLADQYLAPFARAIHNHNQTILLVRANLAAFGIEQDSQSSNRISIDEVSASVIEPLPKLYELLDRAVQL